MVVIFALAHVSGAWRLILQLAINPDCTQNGGLWILSKSPDYDSHAAILLRFARLRFGRDSMRTVFLRSLLAAVLIGPAIGLLSELASLRDATKYDPPLSEAEMQQMKGLPLNEVEASLRGRRKAMTRWEWLEDSVPYSYFWKQLAEVSVLPSSGVFLGCVWVGWTTKRQVLQQRP